MKTSQLIVAAGIAAASFVGLGGVAGAAPTTSTAAVGCVNGDGVMDLMVTNPAPDAAAENDASVSTLIACDALACPSGVLTTIIDDNGVAQQACVDSAASAPVAAAPEASPLQSASVPARAELPATGKGTGGLIIAALLVGSGSVASLLSRRKADRP